MVNFSDIDLAFEFVNAAEFGMNSAFLCKDTGQIYFESELGDSDELPDDIDDSNKYIKIPHKRDLDLGMALVREFANEYIPEKADEVKSIFRNKGAYSQYKELLNRCDALEKWHQFEEERTVSALKDWCVENNIQLEESGADDIAVDANKAKAANDS